MRVRPRPVANPAGVTYYVSPNGSDGNPGTIGSPWLTLGHAQTAVRALVGAMAANITVVVRGGLYPLSSTLAFTSADSGQNGYRVIWQAMPGGTVVLSGGVLLTTWTLFDAGKNIWRAAVTPGSDFRQLYADDLRVTRAQMPETLLSGAGRTGTGFTGTGGAYNNYAIVTDLEFIWRDSYREPRCAVTATALNSITLASPCWTNMQSQWVLGAHNPAFVEGAYEILASVAAPGTFYLNKVTNFAYYIPPVGVNPNNQIVYAPLVVGTLLSVTGASAITFAGLHLMHTNWLQAHTSDGFCEGSDTGFVVTAGGHGGGDFPPGAVFLSGCTNVSLLNCAILHTGAAGIWLDFGCVGCLVQGCEVSDTSASGICCALWGPLVTVALTSTCSLLNNYVHDVGLEYHAGPGIFCPEGYALTVSHNRIENTPYIGLMGGFGGAAIINGIGNNTYSYNDIGPAMTVLDDGGGLYVNSVQGGTTIHHNAIHDVRQTNFGAALYLDDGSEYYSIHDNYCWTIAKWCILTNDTVGNNVITNTYSDNTVYQNQAGVLNGRGGAAADSVAPVVLTAIASIQSLAAGNGAGLQPGYLFLTQATAGASFG